MNNRHNSSIFNFNAMGFVLKAIFFCFVVLFFCFHIVMPQFSEKYSASIIDKVKRLKSIDGPKVVLIGNSNVAFGVDSALIEDALGMPVVNMGLSAEFGNDLLERIAMFNVCEGDIYIICHSNYAGNKLKRDDVLLWTLLENHYNLWGILTSRDILPLIREYPIYFRRCIDLWLSEGGNRPESGCYSRGAFNEYGDIAVGLTDECVYTFTEPVEPPEIEDETIMRINEMNQRLQAKGAVLLVAGYPIGKGELTAPIEDFVATQEELERRLTCPFISDYSDYMYEYDMFYDTPFHLNDSGRRVRTMQLIEDLKAWKEEQR